MICLPREFLDELFAHAHETDPAECCGLIGGSKDDCGQSIYRLSNVAANSQVAYEAAPEELFAAQRLMRERGETLLAIYHSHPRSAEPEPSETDVRLAFYPSATYLIIGLGGAGPTMRAFQLSEREQHWEEVEYKILDE
jgi:[CysO sulfur-carrier protein]-S-L-cysteine hydrolase